MTDPILRSRQRAAIVELEAAAFKLRLAADQIAQLGHPLTAEDVHAAERRVRHLTAHVLGVMGLDEQLRRVGS